VIVIARATGWTENFIRWKLPLSRGWSYFHAARLLDGAPMTIPGGTREDREWWEKIESKFSN